MLGFIGECIRFAQAHVLRQTLVRVDNKEDHYAVRRVRYSYIRQRYLVKQGLFDFGEYAWLASKGQTSRVNHCKWHRWEVYYPFGLKYYRRFHKEMDLTEMFADVEGDKPRSLTRA